MTRRPNQFLAERFSFSFDAASTNVTATTKLWKTPSGRAFKIERVFYNNPTGLATDASNYFDVRVQHGAGPTVAAQWSTLTGAEGALAANTPVDLTLSATAANRVVPAATEISLSLVKTGTQTLPAGRVVVEGTLS